MLKISTALHRKPHPRAMERHLPHDITWCYLPLDTGERAQP